MWYLTDYVAASCDCDAHAGRELRLWTGLKHLAAIRDNAAAVHNAATGAARMPFAFTANAGVVMADRIPA
jgi:hypothetical protein